MFHLPALLVLCLHLEQFMSSFGYLLDIDLVCFRLFLVALVFVLFKFIVSVMHY